MSALAKDIKLALTSINNAIPITFFMIFFLLLVELIVIKALFQIKFDITWEINLVILDKN
jgi:hypothetical protein